MPVQSFDNFELYYEIHGTGTPVMLVPGLAGIGDYWTPQIEALAKSFQVVTHDHRGCGRSSRSRIDYSIEQMANDLVMLMDILNIKRAHLVGHSTGGAMGQVIAIECPERLISLTLTNTWTKACPFRKRVMATRKALLRDSGAEAYIAATPLFLYPSWWIRDHWDMLEKTAQNQISNFPPAEIQISRIDAGLKFNRTADLGLIQTPTLVIGARDDHLTPAYYSEELATLIPDAKLCIFEQGAHSCSQTISEEFNRVILEFLQSQEILSVS